MKVDERSSALDFQGFELRRSERPGQASARQRCQACQARWTSASNDGFVIMHPLLLHLNIHSSLTPILPALSSLFFVSALKTMATERLNSILSHLTPGKSGLSAMYSPSPPSNSLPLLIIQQNAEEPRRCSYHPRHTNAPDQSRQRWPQRHTSRLHRLHPTQAGPRQVKN